MAPTSKNKLLSLPPFELQAELGSESGGLSFQAFGSTRYLLACLDMRCAWEAIVDAGEAEEIAATCPVCYGPLLEVPEGVS